jgi:hypothetical protein
LGGVKSGNYLILIFKIILGGKKILFWARRKIELPNFCPKETLLLERGRAEN